MSQTFRNGEKWVKVILDHVSRTSLRLERREGG